VIAVFKHTEAGGHSENQDCLDIRLVGGAGDCYLCAVADGQGGQHGAAFASVSACKACLETAFTYPRNQLLTATSWPTVLRTADEAVADATDAGFTTLVGFCLTETALCGGSSGDSALVVWNECQPACVLTKHQAKNPPVGSRGAVFVPFASRLLSPWTVLAMTDGVWKYAGWECVLSAASEGTGQAIINKLRGKAALPSSGRLQDDFTLVVFQG
jgi:serine/threonine protein phosphatase PrpC